jgi:hypothetical protein
MNEKSFKIRRLMIEYIAPSGSYVIYELIPVIKGILHCSPPVTSLLAARAERKNGFVGQNARDVLARKMHRQDVRGDLISAS